MKPKLLVRVLMAACGLLLAMALSLHYVQQISQAQGPVGMTKVLNKSDNVVRVGEVLTFTIALTNTSNFTLTKVTLVDDYDESTLQLAGAAFPWDSHESGTGTIIWTNVATPPIFASPGMPPGASINFTVVFTAVSPKAAVVNAVRAQDLESESALLTETVETSRTQEAIGNRLPLFKGIDPPGSVPQVGAPVTFTHVVTNDGAAALIRLPLTDTYDATFLEFQFAIPTPTFVMINPPVGILIWDNLVDFFGPISPFATVVVTTVFTATGQVVDTVNEARVEGALDEFRNDLGAWATQVPIVIIELPTSTPTPTPVPKSDNDNDNDNSNDNEDEEDRSGSVPDTPTPAPTPIGPVITATPVATSTMTGPSPFAGPGAPRYLPETGYFHTSTLLVLIPGLALLLLGWYLRKLR